MNNETQELKKSQTTFHFRHISKKQTALSNLYRHWLVSYPLNKKLNWPILYVLYTIIYITIWTAGGCGRNCYGLDNTPVQTCQSVRLSVISITELTLKWQFTKTDLSFVTKTDLWQKQGTLLNVWLSSLFLSDIILRWNYFTVQLN